MARRPLGLFSLGVFAVVIAISLIGFYPEWNRILSAILAFSGVWVIVLAGIRAKSPEKYERGAFSTFAWGTLLIALGGAWFLFELNWLYPIVLLLIVIGMLAVASALRTWRK